MNVDWKTLATTTLALAKVVNTADSVRIKTPNGSSLSFFNEGKKSTILNGNSVKRGAFVIFRPERFPGAR